MSLRQRIKEWFWKFAIRHLKHVERETGWGGKVIILNTGSVIGQEAVAMLQALHSRSVGGLLEHLKVLAKKGAKNFMAIFYVGYGHKSIGDCGVVTIFIENVSMLVAKAIQDWLLYSGQEASTRYINFATQKFFNPHLSFAGEEIQERWRTFYVNGMPQVVASLKGRFPRKETDNIGTYNKAIDARAFDILRGFLPAGASTNLAWTSNFRQVADHLMLLRHHPLEEAREVALAIESACMEAFPSSFVHKKYEATEAYNKKWMRRHYYFEAGSHPDFECSVPFSNFDGLSEYEEMLKTRPAKTELPKRIAECGMVQFRFLLDFASFRDIQRQRAVIQRMPLLVTTHGFEQWYVNELPRDLQGEALALLEEQRDAVENLGLDKEVAQYYTPMGYRIPCVVTGDIPALVYLVELRATKFVHPTLCKRAREMAESLKEQLGEAGLILHLDTEPNMFDVRRGEHDIKLKD